MLSKKRVINTVFILSFAWYGYGSYALVKQGFGKGVLITTLPYVFILVFYLLDLLYRQAPAIRVNRKFYWVLGAIASMAGAVLLGLHYHSPVITPENGALLIILFAAPFLSSVVVQAYNQHDPGFNIGWMITLGLLGYVGINLAGMAVGMRNLLHTFGGRASPPFAMGIYDAAHFFAIVNLVLLGYLRDFKANPSRWLAFAALYVVNLMVILSINSRLSVMIFLVLTVLFATRAMKVLRGVYTVSLFTVPIMMSFGLLIYAILSLPFFTAIVERVNKKDILTFNGRTYLWDAGINWLEQDRRGLVFGNGYNGHYRLRLLDGVAKLWGEPHSYNLHFHSSFFETLVNQGLIGIVFMYGVYWMGYSFYRKQYITNGSMAPLYAAFVYLLFVWQIDIVCYSTKVGYMLVFVFLGPVVMKHATTQPDGTPVKGAIT